MKAVTEKVASGQQSRKAFAEFYWRGHTDADRSAFYRNGTVKMYFRAAWSSWQAGVRAAAALSEEQQP